MRHAGWRGRLRRTFLSRRRDRWLRDNFARAAIEGPRGRRLYPRILIVGARGGRSRRLQAARANHLAVIGIEEKTHPPPLVGADHYNCVVTVVDRSGQPVTLAVKNRRDVAARDV
jgi:hypothetical protein